MSNFEEWAKEQEVGYSPEELKGKNFEFKVTGIEDLEGVTIDPPQHLYGKIADVGNLNSPPYKGKGIPLKIIEPNNLWFKTTGGNLFGWIPEKECWYHKGLFGELTIKESKE